jgi:predicted metal-dependent hydrolase
VAIDARDVRFELGNAVASHWSPGEPEFSHVANGFMATLPYLEPYFIHNIHAAAEQLPEGELRSDAEGFNKQEARHAQQHRTWNEVLAKRYPGFDALEDALKKKLAHSRRAHSLAFRLAYTAGFEAITYQVVCFILEERERWLGGADPNLIAMLIWHAAEEVEHKSVAFDVYQAIHGGYWMRAFGLVSALVHTIRDLRKFTQHMLRGDGLWEDPKSRKRLSKVRIALLKRLIPPLRAYLRPGYHPSQHPVPPVIDAWLRSYREGNDLRALDSKELDALAAVAASA